MLQDYKGLLSASRAHGVKYLIVGGYAVIFHAQPRFTKDIAIFIKADPANAQATFAALAAFGAALEAVRPEDFTERGSFSFRTRPARLRYSSRHPRRRLRCSMGSQGRRRDRRGKRLWGVLYLPCRSGRGQTGLRTTSGSCGGRLSGRRWAKSVCPPALPVTFPSSWSTRRRVRPITRSRPGFGGAGIAELDIF